MSSRFLSINRGCLRLCVVLALACLIAAGGGTADRGALAQGTAAQGAPPAATAPQQATPQQTTPPQATPPAQPAAEPAQPAPPPAPVLSPSEQRDIEQILRPIGQLKSDIERLEKSVERNQQNETELSRLRAELLDVLAKTAETRDSLTPRSEALRQQIEKLGPPPAKDAAPESAEVAQERARLNALAAEVDGGLKSTELVVVRARQLRDTVQTARQTLFASQILKRSPSPLFPSTWENIIADAPAVWRQGRDTLSAWATLAGRKSAELGGLAVGVLLLFAVLAALVRRIVSYRLDAPRVQPPTFFARAATIGWVAPLLAVPGIAAVSALGLGLDELRLLTLEIGQIATIAFPALYVFVAVSALTRAVLQPRRPDWRLVDLSTPAAVSLSRTIRGLALVFAADLVLQETIRRLYLPFSISVMETALACIAIAALMLKLVRTPFDPNLERAAAEPKPPAGDGAAAVAPAPATGTPSVATAVSPTPFLSPLPIKLPILIAGTAILVLALLGYIGFARFIAQQVIVTGSAIAVILVFHLAIRALLGAPGTGIKPFATVLEERAGLDATQSDVLARALSALLNVALALAAVPLILLTWGYSPGEALAWVRAAVFGFQIGEFRISLVRILFAALLFLALVFATRVAQRWLDTGVLKSKRIDQGIANSIHTAVGYAGFIVAVLAAISYGGLDITNFAIVAGALSVGIGFGLQSIINNFVSGLILLVERPIKVGDRVTVKGLDGYVRRISVRSTEIETLDKASLIVPNSELITGTVTNWTHRNAIGAATVRVTVGYRADADRVREVLRAVAAESSLVLQHPPPNVTLEAFGPNGMEFALGTVVADVTKAASVQSELRFRIAAAFRAAGIEMPHSQHDVHLRDLDMVRTVLARLADERARQGGGGPGPDQSSR